MKIFKLGNISQPFIVWFQLFLFCNRIVSSLPKKVFNPYTVTDNIPSSYCKPDNLKPPKIVNSFVQVTQCFQEFAKFDKSRQDKKSDYGFRADQVIANHGYNFKIYNNVTSTDGYIQTMFRITGSPKSPPRKGKSSVLLLHGMANSCDQWLLLGDKSLPFVLADAGYEVWLANFRGTDYSQRHVKLNPNFDFQYWDFSFHEIAVIDVPLYVDLILNETGQEKVFMIGHSLGALIATIALAENSHLNGKIQAAFLYGPIVMASRSSPFLKLAANLLYAKPEVSNFLLQNVILGGIPAGNWFLNRAYASICSATAFSCGLCGTLVSLTGLNHGHIAYTDIPNYASRLLNTLSIKTLLHIIQMRRKCKLEQYDYGPVKNAQVYGRTNPPLYNLKRVRAHVYIYYGLNDTIATPEDQQVFVDAFPVGTVQVFERVNATTFDHTAFVSDKNAPRLLYNVLIKDMNKYVAN